MRMRSFRLSEINFAVLPCSVRGYLCLYVFGQRNLRWQEKHFGLENVGYKFSDTWHILSLREQSG